jgi:hypothetical protein
MSLRGVHLVLISVAVFLLFGFGIFQLLAYQRVSAVPDLVVAIVSFVLGLALAGYGVSFFKKSRKIML